MILDAQNMFFDKADMSKTLTSNIINVGAGDAYDPMWLYAGAKGLSSSGAITVKLETSDTEDFTSSDTLATYAALPIKAKLPLGGKKYLKLTITNTYTTGELTATLVNDVNIQ